MQPLDPNTPKTSAEQIIWRHRWTDTLYSLRSTRPHGFAFKAGQYARLGLEIDGAMVSRAYSITSTPDDDFLEYLIVTVRNGQFTSTLDDLEIGAAIQVDRLSYGFMTPDRFTEGAALWMLATGTGVGPYISMLRERGIWRQFARLILVHGTRTQAESAYAEELAAMVDQAPFADARARLTYVQAISGAVAAPGRSVLVGRITALLQGGDLEFTVGEKLDVERARVMLCGNPAMIEDVRTLLHARGMRPCRRALPGQFVTENYW